MTSREGSNSKGVRRWLHPITKGSRKDEHRAHLTARHVKEVPLDVSLLKGGSRNYGTHRVRRKGLPSHVPPSWLVPQPSNGSLDQGAVGKQGEENFVIKAGRPSGHAQSAAKLPQTKSNSSPAQSSQKIDSTYSYVFPHGESHRPQVAAEHKGTQGSEGAISAHVENLHQAGLSESESPPTDPSAENCVEFSAKRSALDSSNEAMQHSCSGPDSFAFPELPGLARSFASIPLKPLPRLPAGACSAPGPLEESLLRHKGDAAGSTQGLSQDITQQPSVSSQPISSPCGYKQGISSSSQPRSSYRDGQGTHIPKEPGKVAFEAHSVYKAGSTEGPCVSASAKKLGPHFQRLVASFHGRKAQQTPDYSSRTYSNPVFTTTGLSDILQALKAHSAEAADASDRCLSEDTMTSTAATKHPRSSDMSRMPGHPKQKITGAGHGPKGRAVAGCGKQAQQAGLVSSMHREDALLSREVSRHMASFREEKHGGQGSQRPLLTVATRAAQDEQTARAGSGSYSAPVSRAVIGPAMRCMHAAQAPTREASARALVTPADISAEAAEQAISRQLQAILGMLCAAAALFFTCSVLLSWLLFLVAEHPSKSEDAPLEGTNYASLIPAWWPS